MKIITGIVAGVILIAGMTSIGHAGAVSASARDITGFRKTSSTNQKSGRDSNSQGKNSAGRDRYENKQKYDNSAKAGGNLSQNSNSNNRFSATDNRSWDLSNRSVNTTASTDNRNFSDNSQRTSVDSRNMSDNRNLSDNRNMSDNRVTTTIDSRDMSDNQRHQSHNYGDGSIVINGEGYKPRVGHENASVGGISGSNNYVDQSVSGNFGIGHTTTK